MSRSRFSERLTCGFGACPASGGTATGRWAQPTTVHSTAPAAARPHGNLDSRRFIRRPPSRRAGFVRTNPARLDGGLRMKRRESKLPWGRAAAGAVLCTVVGCAHRPVAVPPLAGQAPKPQVSRSENLERLIRVYNQRTAAAGDGDYVLGPGDVLEIRAFDLEEMNQQRVRVDGDGTITLPLL